MFFLLNIERGLWYNGRCGWLKNSVTFESKSSSNLNSNRISKLRRSLDLTGINRLDNITVGHTNNTLQTSDGDVQRNFWQLRRYYFRQINLLFFHKMNVATTTSRMAKWNKVTGVKSIEWLHTQLELNNSNNHHNNKRRALNKQYIF